MYEREYSEFKTIEEATKTYSASSAHLEITSFKTRFVAILLVKYLVTLAAKRLVAHCFFCFFLYIVPNTCFLAMLIILREISILFSTETNLC